MDALDWLPIALAGAAGCGSVVVGSSAEAGAPELPPV